MGNFRWLTVGPNGQPDIAAALMAIPSAPIMDTQMAQQVRDVMAKGFAGTLFLTTDDVHAAYKQLKERGVEFVEEPQEQPGFFEGKRRGSCRVPSRWPRART